MSELKFTPEAQEELSRRNLLKGALVVGFSGAAVTVAIRRAQAQPFPAINGAQVDSWIAIGADESITAYTGKCEFGQGFRTVQYQLVAEELNVPISRVNLIICDTSRTPDQGVTSGSQSHPAEFGPAGLRQALATARDAMYEMAARALNVSVDALMMEDGAVVMRANPARRMTFGQLVGGRRFTLTLNASAKPKDPRQYRVLGTSVRRADIPLKVTGQLQYVHHVRLPGMLHGKVVRPPKQDMKLVSVKRQSIAGMPGNPQVVVKSDFVGVVAEREWFALQAAQALEVTWEGGSTLPPFETVYQWMRQQPSRDAFLIRAADVDDKMKAAARTLNATYLHPYQMHGSLGSSCAVADVRGSGANASATIWCSSQGVYPQRDSVSRVLGLTAANVRVIWTEGSGCYGINGSDTVAYDAAILSQAVGKPVRVQYTRKDEMVSGENFGPAFTIDLKAGVDAQGNLVAWDYQSWLFAKGGRPNANTPGNIISGALAGFATPPIVPTTTPTVAAAYSNNSNADSSYSAGCVGTSCGGTGTLRSVRVLTRTIQSPFFTGPLRSPNRLQNTFANESFMDEIASALRLDPVAYRLRHLSDERLAECVRQAALKAGWDTRPSPKPNIRKTGIATGRGIACCLYEGDNGYCAMLVEVEVDQDTGAIVLKRIVCSQDSGPVSNPDGMRNQMEGGALQGCARALTEEVRWNDRGLTSVDWRRYAVFNWGQPQPVMENVIIDRPDVPQMGAGECTITCAAAAIGNAVFDATGARLREVPFTPDRVLAALQARP